MLKRSTNSWGYSIPNPLGFGYKLITNPIGFGLILWHPRQRLCCVPPQQMPSSKASLADAAALHASPATLAKAAASHCVASAVGVLPVRALVLAFSAQRLCDSVSHGLHHDRLTSKAALADSALEPMRISAPLTTTAATVTKTLDQPTEPQNLDFRHNELTSSLETLGQLRRSRLGSP